MGKLLLGHSANGFHLTLHPQCFFFLWFVLLALLLAPTAGIGRLLHPEVLGSLDARGLGLLRILPCFLLGIKEARGQEAQGNGGCKGKSVQLLDRVL